MKSKGIVRNIDPLGRLVIPKEIRKEVGFTLGEPVEIVPQDNYVIIRKYENSCILCGSSFEYMKKVIIINEKKICEKCQEKINSKK